MSILVGGRKWIAAVVCDKCGSQCQFGPMAVRGVTEARRMAAEQHGWHCWNPTPKPGEPVPTEVGRDKDYCASCGPGGLQVYV